jgi:hypothetical protein
LDGVLDRLAAAQQPEVSKWMGRKAGLIRSGAVLARPGTAQHHGKG